MIFVPKSAKTLESSHIEALKTNILNFGNYEQFYTEISVPKNNFWNNLHKYLKNYPPYDVVNKLNGREPGNYLSYKLHVAKGGSPSKVTTVKFDVELINSFRYSNIFNWHQHVNISSSYMPWCKASMMFYLDNIKKKEKNEYVYI